MKILIICQYYYPEQFLINDIAPQLVKDGHEVTVLTGLPNYPDGVIKKGYINDDTYQGVHIIRCHEIGRKKGILLNYLSFLFSANRKIKKIKEVFDVVFVYQLSPITMAIPAIKYRKNHSSSKLFLYCLDIWPESMKAHLGGPIYKMVAKLSKNTYQQFDRIGVTSRPFIDYMVTENGIERNKLVYIPQHAIGNMIGKDLSFDNKIIDFLFAGNLGKGQTLDVIIRALALVDRDYKMHFVGAGSMESKLKALTKELGLENKVIFYGKKTYEEMEEFYKLADALIITLRGNNAVGNTMPGKLQTYMSIGKPIFGAINGAANEIIHEANCGACVNAGDYYGLAGLLTDYIDNPYKYANCGINGRKYFNDNFTFEIFMKKLEKELLEC